MRMRVAFIYIPHPSASHKVIPFLSVHTRQLLEWLLKRRHLSLKLEKVRE